MQHFVDLTREYQKEKKEINTAVQKVLNSGIFLNGFYVSQFEKSFADFLGVENVIGVGSGTDAITLALKTLSIGQGDEVILPTNVYPSIYGVLQSGAGPIFADVNPKTYNLDRKSLEKIKLSKKIKAILFVHLYGNPSGILEVAEFARKHKLFLVEDVAHAHGALLKGKMAGSFGDISCFSFYPTKPLGAYGDAGAIASASKRLAKTAIFLRNRAEKKRFVSEKTSVYTHLDDIQAAILSVKLGFLKMNNQKRQTLAAQYVRQLSGLPLEFQQITPACKHAYMHFVIKINKRDKLQAYLKKYGIPTDVHYPLPLHLQPSLAYLGHKKGDFPIAESLSQQVLSLPLYPYMEKGEMRIVIQAIQSFFHQK